MSEEIFAKKGYFLSPSFAVSGYAEITFESLLLTRDIRSIFLDKKKISRDSVKIPKKRDIFLKDLNQISYRFCRTV